MTDAKVTTISPAAGPARTAPAAGTAKRRRSGAGRIVLIVGAFVVIAAAAAAWFYFSRPALPAGFAGGNGRLEANQVYVSTKYPGRIAEVMFNEGDTVEAGQVVARMDTSALEAQLREAEAQIAAAQENRVVAQTQVAVKQADYNFARQQNDRSQTLVSSGGVSRREAEVDQAAMLSTRAQLAGTKAQVDQAQSNIVAAQATADRLRAEIKDAVLVAPIRSRVETRLAEPGEVLPAGGRVFSVNDLSDVYMYVYLPSEVTGKVPLGSEARIVLDAAQQYPIRAYVAFVSPMAQFTPKTVETAEERHNLTFRVKLQIPKERLAQYEPLVKTGLPGMGYVRSDQSKSWPDNLQPKANPPADLWKPTGGTGAPR
jgi:HlyD family secretion protein